MSTMPVIADLDAAVEALLAEGRAKLAAEQATREEAEQARIEEEERERARGWVLLRAAILPVLGPLGPYLPEDPPEDFAPRSEYDLHIEVPGFAPIHRYCQWQDGPVQQWLPAPKWFLRHWFQWEGQAVEGEETAWATEDIAVALAYAAMGEAERLRVQAAAGVVEQVRQDRAARRAEMERHTPVEGRFLAALRDMIDSRLPEGD